MKFYLNFLLLFFPLFCFGQTNISGNWIGTITQKEGGYRSKYKFELYLKQSGSELSGRSYVYVDNIYAEMILKGRIVGDQVTLYESEIIEFKEFEGMEWCIKNCKLKLVKSGKNWKLEGGWEGFTSFGACIPGSVFLQKIVPRV
jgi:hypothetical protein